MMILEFLGIFMFSIFMGTISDLLGHEPQLSDIIDERMEELDVWLRKLDKSRTGLLPRTTYEAIKDFVLKSFFHDFNLIRGEEFFDQLKPRIRHKMVKELFSQFQENFNYMFEDDDFGFEAGKEFISDFLSNLYSRQFIPDKAIIMPGD